MPSPRCDRIASEGEPGKKQDVKRQHGHLPESGVEGRRCPILPTVWPLIGITRTVLW